MRELHFEPVLDFSCAFYFSSPLGPLSPLGFLRIKLAKYIENTLGPFGKRTMVDLEHSIFRRTFLHSRWTFRFSGGSLAYCPSVVACSAACICSRSVVSICMLGVPTICGVAMVAIADRERLVGRPRSHFCWHAKRPAEPAPHTALGPTAARV